MRNRNQLLADFYLELLAIPMCKFRIQHQKLYAEVLFALSDELESDNETVQRIFECLAREDGK